MQQGERVREDITSSRGQARRSKRQEQIAEKRNSKLQEQAREKREEKSKVQEQQPSKQAEAKEQGERKHANFKKQERQFQIQMGTQPI